MVYAFMECTYSTHVTYLLHTRRSLKCVFYVYSAVIDIPKNNNKETKKGTREVW